MDTEQPNEPSKPSQFHPPSGTKHRKKNFLRIPRAIAQKVKKLSAPDIVVACTRKIPAEDLIAGRLVHVGITVVNGQVAVRQEPFLPHPKAGRHSRCNIDGREIVRKDLPMTTKTISFETPNYGDWAKGSHETSWDRDVYQRQHEAPRNLDMSVELLFEEPSGNGTNFVFRFTVNSVLRRGTKGFDAELLYTLNLLQENVGAADVFPANATREDYLKTINVAWEILPPGEVDATIAKVLSHFRKPSDEVKALISDRAHFLATLKPTAYVLGSSGFARYFGAQFADNLVVFENLEYGNAIYVMFDEWEKLSQQSRLELLRGNRDKFQRIVHAKSWKTALKKLVNEKRPKTH